MSNELTTQLDASAVEAVLISGDLSKLTPPQRVNYYKSVCESIGLNPLTKPFDYITLNGKLTLYAKKDATDQLRSLKGVSIDDVDLQEVGDHFIVKVKGHDNTGRADVEIGVVNKKDMQGNLANAQMKAVTKAKRRLTLSLCGLGWLDETEVETIPDAKPVIVEETGEIVKTDPLAETKKYDFTKRPYDADTLRAAIVKKAKACKDATEMQVQLAGMMLAQFFGDDTKCKEAKHYLFGVTSLKEADQKAVTALLNWMNLKQDSGGAYVMDDMAQKELNKVLDAYALESGQDSLFTED